MLKGIINTKPTISVSQITMPSYENLCPRTESTMPDRTIHDASICNPKHPVGLSRRSSTSMINKFWSLYKKNIRMAFPVPDRQHE